MSPPSENESTRVYDLFIWFFGILLHIFFRSVRVRGAWRIPNEGPIILVGAPHANQFVDPVLLGVEVNRMSGRRPSFLMAEKSYAHPYIGALARFMKAIPVGRAQDSFTVATGEVYSDGHDSLRLFGVNTSFQTEAAPGKNVSLQGHNDIAPISEVVSDTELILAKPFKSSKCQQMMEAGFEPLGFKIGEKVDNTNMFHSVFEHLSNGGSLGIFPEGGSHDRPEMLPLKPGVAIMALGSVAYRPGLKVAIVPVGLNYFHPHKFRSRAVYEFGEPLYIDDKLAKEYIEGGPEGKKASVAKLMSRIVDALQLVTINCPDYETLLVVQAGQRLYKRERYIPLSLTIEFTRRFVQGFLQYRERDPRIQQIFNDVQQYNKQLRTLGISDHQVPSTIMTKRRLFRRLVRRVFCLAVISAASLPGVILGSPVLIITKVYSQRQARLALASSSVKIQAHDVMATWKILVSLVLVPTLFSLYSIIDCWYIFTQTDWLPFTVFNVAAVFLLCFWGLILFSYATIIVGEAGMDMARSIKPLYLALSPYHKSSLSEISTVRDALTVKITEIVNDLGPQIFPDIADRLEKIESPRDVQRDPRIDLRGLNSSINLKGDYDLAKVPIFSRELAPAVLFASKKKKSAKAKDSTANSSSKQNGASSSSKLTLTASTRVPTQSHAKH